MGRRGWRGGVLLALLVLAGLDQLLQHSVLGDGMFLGVPVAPFDPPLFSPSQHEAFDRIRAQLSGKGPVTGKFDPELGWCNPPESGFGEFRYDWAGARIGVTPLAREKAAGVRRIVAVGCSMTHGEEVGATESWCAQLDARLPDIEVANLGVAAYGIDQALMRLRRDGFALDPDEVWLGLLPQAALRTTTFFRPILDHWSLDVAFKPRFLLGSEGELELASNPAQSYRDIERLLSDQKALLSAFGGRDPWVARSAAAYAPRGSDWKHHTFAGRIWLTLDEKRGRRLAHAFDPEHDFGRLLTAIISTMQHDCSERGVRLRVLILPGKEDLARRSESGHGYWEPWCDVLRAREITVEDLSAALVAAGALESFAPHGHYSVAGSRVVSEALLERLRAP